jgi:hypothetical protein
MHIDAAYCQSRTLRLRLGFRGVSEWYAIGFNVFQNKVHYTSVSY